jgi:adenylate cyclase
VLFADISDSTRLYDELGDEGGRRLLLECLALLRQVVERCGGTVVDQVGDELMCTFPDPIHAGRASCELHRAIEANNSRFLAKQSIRVGFHHGPLLVEESQIFGDTVHVARRVTSQAKTQQTLTTRQTRDLIPAEAKLATRFVDRTHLKGKDESFELFEIEWDMEAATVASRLTDMPATGQTQVQEFVLRHGEQTYTLDSMHPTLTIGRGSQVDVVIDHNGVSRLHARIEYRKGTFTFVDQSTNGSQVIDADNHRRRFVRRDEYRLLGEGTIVLGPDGSDVDFPTLAFRLGWGDPTG